MNIPPRRRSVSIIGCTLLLLVILVGPARPQMPEKTRITVGVNPAFRPYMFLDEHGDIAGFNIDMMNAVARKRNLEVEYRVMEWADMIREFRKGGLDALASLVYTVEGTRFARFTSPTTTVEFSFFVKDGSKYNHPSRLSGQRVAVQTGLMINDQLRRVHPDTTLIPAYSPEDMFALLDAGAVDAVMLPHHVGVAVARRLGMDDSVRPIIPPIFVYDLRIAVHSSREGLFRKIEGGLLDVKSTPEYPAIQERWFTPHNPFLEQVWSWLFTFALISVIISMLMFFWTRMLHAKVSRAKRELAETDAFFSLLASQSIAGTLITQDGMIVHANRAITDMLGIPPWTDFPRPIPVDKIHKDDHELLFERISKREQGLIDVDFMPIRLIRPDGSLIHAELHSRNITWKGKMAILTTAINVDERERTRRRIYLTRKTYQTIIEHGPFGVVMRDSNLKVVFANRRYLNLTGRTLAELQNTSIEELAGGDEAEHIKAGLLLVLEGSIPTFRFEAPYHRPDGTTRVASIIAARSDADSLIIMATDVTQATEQRKIIQLQARLAAMGEMLGVIAHQWQQPLNALSVYISSLGLANARGTLDAESLAQMLDGTNRQITFMNDTIEDFRGRFRPSGTFETFSTWGVIKDVERMAEVQLKRHGISLETINQHDDDPLDITGPQNEFMHVVFNLVSNAREAIIHTADASSPRYIVITASRENSDILIRVSDSGGGIPHDVLPSIFDPYFTTKQDTDGTGIGLYLARQIIESGMQGDITAGNVGDGAEFVIRVPAAEGTVREGEAS